MIYYQLYGIEQGQSATYKGDIVKTCSFFQAKSPVELVQSTIELL